jgi:hypothetical protein
MKALLCLREIRLSKDLLCGGNQKHQKAFFCARCAALRPSKPKAGVLGAAAREPTA